MAVRDATRYVERCKIPGAIVECGVWRGGAMMAAALTLAELGSQRDIYLFDTYEGMTQPTEADIDLRGVSARDYMDRFADRPEGMAYASLEDVRKNMETTGYDPSRFHFVKGPVEETLPAQAPETIALLRLDTDWYESTKHEIEHLLPALSDNGVLIVDDYGYWAGSRKAVDELLAVTDRPILLNRTDYTGRMAVVPLPAQSSL